MLNTVDHVIKHHMLESPNLFPDRLSVLAFLLLSTSGGYRWNDNGEVESVFGMPKPRKTINMDDLNQQMRFLRKEVEAWPDSNGSQIAVVNLEIEMHARKHRGKNIDLFVKETIATPALGAKGIFMLEHLNGLAGTLLGSLPQDPTRLHPDWAHAAGQLALACENALKKSRENNTPVVHQEALERDAAKALDALEPVIHFRENRARNAKAMVGVAEQMLAILTRPSGP